MSFMGVVNVWIKLHLLWKEAIWKKGSWAKNEIPNKWLDLRAFNFFLIFLGHNMGAKHSLLSFPSRTFLERCFLWPICRKSSVVPLLGAEESVWHRGGYSPSFPTICKCNVYIVRAESQMSALVSSETAIIGRSTNS